MKKFNTEQSRLIELVKKWRCDPLSWVHHFFPDDTFTKQQESAWVELGKLINAKFNASLGKKLSVEERRYSEKIGISIMSGNGTGKDAWTAVTILFFLSVFPNPKIPCTAPSAHQLKDVLWSEVSKWIRRSLKDPESGKPVLEIWHEWQGEKVFLREKKGKEHFAVARSVNVKASEDDQAETLAGFHEDYMMFVVDEASGVPDPVYRPIEGTLTGILNFAILIFNPTRSRGFAVRTHGDDAGRWIIIRWNAEESEIVTKEHIEMMAARYGKDSNTYRIRVLGLPPVADSDTLIPWDWIWDARDRDIEPRSTDPIIKTADFGAGGDKSVICTRRGGRVYPFKRKNTQDSNELTDWVVSDIMSSEADVFGGDVIGIGWAIMGSVRKRAPRKCVVRSIDSRSKAKNDRRFANCRAEMYYSLRDAFENKTISIPDDQEVINQLGAIKKTEDSRGRILIAKKDALKKEIGHSPDEADALAESYYFNSEQYQKVEDYDKDEDEDRYEPPAAKWSYMGA